MVLEPHDSSAITAMQQDLFDDLMATRALR